jgi:hypothetical protein
MNDWEYPSFRNAMRDSGRHPRSFGLLRSAPLPPPAPTVWQGGDVDCPHRCTFQTGVNDPVTRNVRWNPAVCQDCHAVRVPVVCEKHDAATYPVDPEERDG